MAQASRGNNTLETNVITSSVGNCLCILQKNTEEQHERYQNPNCACIYTRDSSSYVSEQFPYTLFKGSNLEHMIMCSLTTTHTKHGHRTDVGRGSYLLMYICYSCCTHVLTYHHYPPSYNRQYRSKSVQTVQSVHVISPGYA